jgi:hypothetical protein
MNVIVAKINARKSTELVLLSLCGLARLPSFVCVQMSLFHSALCGVNFEQRQVRKRSAEEEEEEETKSLYDERKAFYSKGKYIFWTAFWIQVVFLYCRLKKVLSNQDYFYFHAINFTICHILRKPLSI